MGLAAMWWAHIEPVPHGPRCQFLKMWFGPGRGPSSEKLIDLAGPRPTISIIDGPAHKLRPMTSPGFFGIPTFFVCDGRSSPRTWSDSRWKNGGYWVEICAAQWIRAPGQAQQPICHILKECAMNSADVTPVHMHQVYAMPGVYHAGWENRIRLDRLVGWRKTEEIDCCCLDCGVEEEQRFSLGRVCYWCNTDYCDVKRTIDYLSSVCCCQDAVCLSHHAKQHGAESVQRARAARRGDGGSVIFP